MSKEIGNECIDEAANILGVERAEALDSFGSWMNETFPEMWAEYGNDVLNGFTYNGNKVGIGRAFTAEGVWRIEHSQGTYISDKKSDNTPSWVIPINEKVNIAMLKPDNTPTLAYMTKAVWTFHGNTKEKFLTEGPTTIKVENQREAADHN